MTQSLKPKGYIINLDSNNVAYVSNCRSYVVDQINIFLFLYHI